MTCCTEHTYIFHHQTTKSSLDNQSDEYQCKPAGCVTLCNFQTFRSAIVPVLWPNLSYSREIPPNPLVVKKQFGIFADGADGMMVCVGCAG